MNTDTRLALHHARAADLRAQADADHLAETARQPRDLRVRLGWTLVEVGLRMASAPRPAVAC
ncbi:hypothetical protein NGF19_00255 [Streptomyces sp. RY43-2]|uniref:Uncharacterized protein n=1 Tax=Streptomyces macrolidinus TaxID=2952607 RepID=A0ABT0Z6Y9_9ACTN|nr:hypothetical protein [Streptomyces macrolidinus]MCN9239235.1 hypothetical protein [Streptomyces macrolidinus]